MSTTLSTAAPNEAAPGEKIFRCGTLEYTKKGLFQLFFWLMWNEFTIMLLEQVNSFAGFLQLDNGATNAQVAIFGTISSVLTFWMNPVFSVWSDRTRTSWGRRRPFLLIATPPLALCIIAIPYMPTLGHSLEHDPAAAHFFQMTHMNGAVLMVGFCAILLTMFNQVVLALFSYLYWDVVPQEVLGRWTGLSKVVSSAGVFIWGFFLMGFADHHMKTLCDLVALFCLSIYLLSIVMVKEGGYAPVDKHRTGGWLAPVRAYFVECYSDPFYLWIFGAFLVAGINNAANNYRGYYLKYDLHVDYGGIGKLNAIPSLIPIVLGYYLGSVADKLNPIRVYAPTFALWGATCFCAYFFIHDRTSYLVWTCIIQVAIFANGITYGALLPEIYPRAKFGQFCSANQLCGTVMGIIVPIPIGMLFDAMHSYYRFAYLFSACFLFGAALMFRKVEKNYKARKGHVPEPHAG